MIGEFGVMEITFDIHKKETGARRNLQLPNSRRCGANSSEFLGDSGCENCVGRKYGTWWTARRDGGPERRQVD